MKNELRPMVDEYLSTTKLKESEFIDAEQVQELVSLHNQGRRDYKYEIWALLVFQIWYEKGFNA